MSYNLSSLFSKINAAFSVTIQHYREEELLESWSQHNFTIDIAKKYMQPYIGNEHPICFVISPEYVLSGYIALDTADEYLILGPAFPYEISQNQAEKILHELELPVSCLEELLRYFHFTPKMSSVNFQNMLSFLYEILYPECLNEPIHLTYQVRHTDFFNEKEFERNEDMSPLTEDNLMSLIAAGMLNEVEQALDVVYNSSEVFLPALAPNGIRALKNSLISSTAIVARKAVEGGLDYCTAMTLSDYYILKIESLTILSELREMLRIMILDFTKRVSLVSHPVSNSPIVNAIYRDVQEHKYEKLTSKDIAKHLSFSNSYISHHFKEVTGITLTQYIHEQKIKETQYLLDTTSLSLAAISEKLGFSSQQQFQMVFKQMTGMTPKQYKKH